MIAAHPFAPLFDPETARPRLEPVARQIWGESVEITRCEVLHVWRKTHARPTSAHKSVARVSFRLGLHDRRRDIHCDALALGLLSFEDGQVRLELRRFPDDPALPQLAQLADARGALAAAPQAVQRHCGSTVEPRVTVVSFRPGERCTLRYDAERAAYAKTFRDDSGAKLAQRLATLGRWALGSEPAIAWPRLLGYDAATRTVWQEAVPDLRPFLDYPARRSIARSPWRLLGAALATLHRGSLPQLSTLTREQRLFEVGKKVAKLEGAGLPAAVDARALHDHCLRAQPRLAAVPDVLLHGDLHIGQLGRTADRVAIFDMDELLLGPAEQDLASLLVSLESNGIGKAPASRALATVIDGYVASGGRLPDSQVLDWHYRLQHVDRAYRDWWRHDVQALGRMARALRRGQRGLPADTVRGAT